MEEQNYFAVDIGGTSVKYALLSSDFKILEKGSFPTPYENAETLADAIVRAAEPWKGQFIGVGVSIPGTVTDHPDGLVQRGGSLTYMDGVPFGKMLSERFGVPCAVENDGKACALGEYASGALQGFHSGVVVVLGTGVGGGIVINGKVWKGAHFFAGEFSYLYDDTSVWPDLRSMCGFSCGSGALRQSVIQHKHLPEDTQLNGVEIFKMAHEGDQDAVAGIRDFCHSVARLICNIQAFFDPEVIAIGGGISADPLLLDLIQEELEVHYNAMAPLRPPKANVVRAQNGNDANMIGAVYRCADLTLNFT